MSTYIPLDQFKPENIIIEKCAIENIPNSKNTYGRSKIFYKNASGAKQTLLLRGIPMSTYGVGDNVDSATGKISHSVCFVYPREGEKVSALDKVFNAIYAKCAQFILDNKDTCKLAREPTDLRDVQIMMKPIANYPKIKDTNKTDPTKPKRFYAKLLEFPADKNRPAKMVTIFDDGTSFDVSTGKMTRTVDPLKVRSSYEMIPSILIDSIYFGTNPSIQVKLPRAVLTRELIMNDAPPIEDVGEYMMSLGLSAPSSKPLVGDDLTSSSSESVLPPQGESAPANESSLQDL